MLILLLLSLYSVFHFVLCSMLGSGAESDRDENLKNNHSQTDDIPNGLLFCSSKFMTVDANLKDNHCA